MALNGRMYHYMYDLEKIGVMKNIDERLECVQKAAAEYHAEKKKEQEFLVPEFKHITNVWATALDIAIDDKSVDLPVLSASALLHHCKDEGFIRSTLSSCGYSEEETDRILYCVAKNHINGDHKSIEAKILYDADILAEKGGFEGMRMIGMLMLYHKNITLGNLIEAQERTIEKGLYTDRARELSIDGSELRLVLEHLKLKALGK